MVDKNANSEHRSIFDENFKYLKIPREVFDIPELNSDDREILSRIVYWTKKEMPCTHTNAQFSELIKKSEKTAKRVVTKLLNRKLISAFYRNNGKLKQRNSYRDLIAIVGVPATAVIERLIAQYTMRAKPLKRSSGQNDPMSPKIEHAHQDSGVLMNDQVCPSVSGRISPSTTNKQLKETTTATPTPLPAGGQAPALPTKIASQEEREEIFRKSPDSLFKREIIARRTAEPTADENGKQQPEVALVGTEI